MTRLQQATPAGLQPLLLLLYHTGVRVGEAEKVEWSAVKDRQGRVFPSKRVMQQAFPKACEAAGVEGLNVHDLRPSAVRSMMISGAQQAVTMKISGHKDASVFGRYNIIDEGQAADAMKRVQQLVPVSVKVSRPAFASAHLPPIHRAFEKTWWEFGGSLEVGLL